MKEAGEVQFIGLKQFIKENAPAGGFVPFAYYDKHLDCIRVQIKDCSFSENRMNRIFTILEANHSDVQEFVGFNIKGVRMLFESIGLPKQGILTLTEIIDEIVKTYPDQAGKLIKEKFGRQVKPLKVEMDIAA